jgi:UDP-3-O-[3-hydroxymyristoyl] N-acetylglucosamine deacetylase
MTLRPAEVDTGIVFHRYDIAGRGAMIPAHWSSVSDTRLNTCVANDAGVSVRTIEHLMAALAGMAIDNVIIDINGPEVPAMDGSSAPFVFLIECAGVLEQSAPRRAVKVLKRVVAEDGPCLAVLTPDDAFTLTVEIDFPASAIRLQELSLRLSSTTFKSELSRARTFGFEQDVAALHAAGLAKGGSLDNAVVIASDGKRVLNEEGLRYEDEFVRHKMLDAIGDLYLAGFPIRGRFHGVRSGHALNNRLLRKLFADKTAWAPISLGSEGLLQRSLPPLRLSAAATA